MQLAEDDRLLRLHEDKLAALAAKSACRHKHAAVLLDPQWQPICWGYNRGSIHAEQDVIAKWVKAFRPRARLAERLLVVRWKPSVGFQYSKPCVHCTMLLNRLNITAMHS